jgi:serine/threonine protein kinase
VIFYEILHGKAPWTCSNEKQLIEEINKNNIYLLKNLSEDLKDFIRRCLAPDEGKRITVK